MALIKCPECGKEISDKAEKCPNCGYPVNNVQNSTNKNRIVIIMIKIIVIVIVSIIIAIIFKQGKEKVDITNGGGDVSMESELLDYSSLVGVPVVQFATIEGITLSEDEEMSTILDCTAMTAEKEIEYMGLVGTIQFRSFTDDQEVVPANHIYDVLWSVGNPDNDKNIVVDAETIKYIVNQYDEYYGKHTEAKDTTYREITSYLWELEDDKIFEIEVFDTMSYMGLHWHYKN